MTAVRDATPTASSIQPMSLCSMSSLTSMHLPCLGSLAFASFTSIRIYLSYYLSRSYSLKRGNHNCTAPRPVPRSQPSGNGGGVVYIRFGTFSGFGNWSSQLLSILGEISIFKITIDDVTSWSKLESTW